MQMRFLRHGLCMSPFQAAENPPNSCSGTAFHLWLYKKSVDVFGEVQVKGLAWLDLASEARIGDGQFELSTWRVASISVILALSIWAKRLVPANGTHYNFLGIVAGVLHGLHGHFCSHHRF